jgi:DNA-binding IclR family transcriptional regulator
MLNLLFQQPNQTVSALAEQVNLSLPVASQYLRALEARGLLEVRRTGRRVTYRPVPANAQSPAANLVSVLRRVFRQDGDPVETIFKTSTAFTHPRRIDVFGVIRNEGQSLFQLRTATCVSSPALYRHLRKLKSRGFVEWRDGKWHVTPRSDRLGQELTQRVSQSLLGEIK